MNVQCPDHVGLYWPIYLLEVNSSIQYSSLIRQTLQLRLCLMMLDWNILLLLAWMYLWHISFMSAWRPWWTCIRASPKRRSCDILLCRYDLILRKALKDRSASALPTGSVQPMHRSCLTFGNWSWSTCWRHPKRLTGWLCAGHFSQWATHSFSSASIAVGVGRSSSQNFMQLRCYILQTWLQLQKVDWDLAESKLI